MCVFKHSHTLIYQHNVGNIDKALTITVFSSVSITSAVYAKFYRLFSRAHTLTDKLCLFSAVKAHRHTGSVSPGAKFYFRVIIKSFAKGAEENREGEREGEE